MTFGYYTADSSYITEKENDLWKLSPFLAQLFDKTDTLF